MRIPAIQEKNENPDRAILLGLIFTEQGEREDSALASLDELEELCASCDIEVLGKDLQQRSSPDAATCAGSGKILELAELGKNMGANCLILNTQLSGTQMRHIADLSDMRVLDRTLVILDIFARRARSSEGVLQVEIAQLKDRLTRLSGSGNALSRLGGGIGTRGPGETKLESDRRHIQRRIGSLNRKLKELAKRRDSQRKNRRARHALVFAVCGYTNAGKSSLVNRLCEADLYTMDQVFATLDPNVRRLKGDGPEILLSDTVGFIRDLPHDLVEAFRSTLDEVGNADFIIQVSDLSDPDMERQCEMVETMLQELGAADKPRIHVLNKADLVPEKAAHYRYYRDREDSHIQEMTVSVKSGRGLEELKQLIRAAVTKWTRNCELMVPYARAELAERVRKEAWIDELHYEEEGIRILCRIPQRELKQLISSSIGCRILEP